MCFKVRFNFVVFLIDREIGNGFNFGLIFLIICVWYLVFLIRFGCGFVVVEWEWEEIGFRESLVVWLWMFFLGSKFGDFVDKV